MPIRPHAAESVSDVHDESWTSTDCLVYALGVGAGSIDPTGFELEFTTENSTGLIQKVLPTFPVVINDHSSRVVAQVAEFDPAMLVHGQQSITLHSRLPTSGTVSITTTITGVYDKGSGAVVDVRSEALLVEGRKRMWTTTNSLFIRGEGGFGGERGPSNVVEIPTRAPDHTVTYPTRPDQSLFYRLSGDRNPLHSDPLFAARGGFDRPILHGRCTFGFTGRALLHTLCGSDPDRFVSMAARFTSPVLPGQDLTVSMWVDGAGEALFRTATDSGIVMDAGRLTYT